METALFDYLLPQHLIAQEAIEPRDAARLMVVPLPSGRPLHQQVKDLPSLLRRGDLVVLNHTKVFPARLAARKPTGGEVEVLLIHREESAEAGERWRALVRGRVRVGTALAIGDEVATVRELHQDGSRSLAFSERCDVLALSERVGRVPLPPYIARPDRPQDRQRYQTIFADSPGSVAAPTAGLHLTDEVLSQLAASGIDFARVDLAIGPGTFKPVDTPTIEEYRIHAERCSCPAETVAAVQRCRARGGRVIAIGTTSARTLESAAAQPGGFAPYSGWTSLYLHPPQRLAVVDGLLTNFHLPRSSLLMLVSCLVGRERLLDLYAQAIAHDYRFFSYGDAMLLLPDDPAARPPH